MNGAFLSIGTFTAEMRVSIVNLALTADTDSENTVIKMSPCYFSGTFIIITFARALKQALCVDSSTG